MTVCADLISLDRALLSLKTNCFVSLFIIPASLSHNPANRAFLLLCQIQLTDMTNSFISWMRVAFFDLLIFSHIWTHIKGVTPFKEGGKYGILSSCELIKARRKQKRGTKTDRWPDIDVAHGTAKPRVQWSLYTHCIQTLCLRIGHCAISFHLGPMKWMDGVITGLGDPNRHITCPIALKGQYH